MLRYRGEESTSDPWVVSLAPSSCHHFRPFSRHQLPRFEFLIVTQVHMKCLTTNERFWPAGAGASSVFVLAFFCVSLACGRNFEDGRWQHSDWKQWRQDNRCWQKHVHHTFGLPKYPITSQFTPCNFSESYTLRANTIVCAWSFLFLFRAPSGFPEKMRWPFVCQEQSKTPQACTQNIAGHDEFGLLKRHVHLSRTSLYTKHADN